MSVTAFFYQIKRKDNNKVVFEGILVGSGDVIYPAQEKPDLMEEFPNLPYECNFYKFKVKGLYTEGFYFSIPVNELKKWKE